MIDIVVRRALIYFSKDWFSVYLTCSCFSLCGCNQAGLLVATHWFLFVYEKKKFKKLLYEVRCLSRLVGSNFIGQALDCWVPPLKDAEDGEASAGCLCLWGFCQDAAPALRLLFFLPASY